MVPATGALAFAVIGTDEDLFLIGNSLGFHVHLGLSVGNADLRSLRRRIRFQYHHRLNMLRLRKEIHWNYFLDSPIPSKKPG